MDLFLKMIKQLQATKKFSKINMKNYHKNQKNIKNAYESLTKYPRQDETESKKGKPSINWFSLITGLH